MVSKKYCQSNTKYLIMKIKDRGTQYYHVKI